MSARFAFLIKILLSLIFIVVIVSTAAAENDFYKSFAIVEFKSTELSQKLPLEMREDFAKTAAAFLLYVEAERENLALLDAPATAGGSIGEENIAFLLDERLRELDMLISGAVMFPLSSAAEDIYLACKFLTQRVPYDRGEPHRATFRKSARAWSDFAAAEISFYEKLFAGDRAKVDACQRYLCECRVSNLRREYKGVMSIKIEKED